MIDHRSHKERGIETHAPGVHHGPGAHLDKRDVETEQAERNRQIRRENYRRFEAGPRLVLAELSRQHSTFDDRDIARFIYRFADTRQEFDDLRLRVGSLSELKVVRAEIHDPETNRAVQRARYTTDEVILREARMCDAAISRLKDGSFKARCEACGRGP